MMLSRSATFGERVFIPPTDDDEDSPNQTSPWEPTHNQPTAPRYKNRLLRVYHATPADQSPNLKAPTTFHTLTHWFFLYVHGVTSNDAKLQNICMDVIREYYTRTGFSASAFRIETLYKALEEHDSSAGALMKKYLVESAAYRTSNHPNSFGLDKQWAPQTDDTGKLSPSFDKMLGKNPAINSAFNDAEARLRKDIANLDPNKGPKEDWHVNVDASLEDDSGVELDEDDNHVAKVGEADGGVRVKEILQGLEKLEVLNARAEAEDTQSSKGIGL